MSKEQLVIRMMCAQARVDSNRVRLGYITPEENRRLAIALSTIGDAPLWIDDKSAATVTDLHARLRRLNADGDVALVIVDYLQLMSAGRKFENRNQEVTWISRGLKLLSSDISAPLMVLSQLSRAPETRKGSNRPVLSDLRESGSLEQDADVVGFLYREEMYHKDREDLRGLAELILGKQRSGPTGTINLVYLHNLTKFENRAEDAPEDTSLLPFLEPAQQLSS
jgi:replicative DNA helicase